jgi:hypothetical protein
VPASRNIKALKGDRIIVAKIEEIVVSTIVAMTDGTITGTIAEMTAGTIAGTIGGTTIGVADTTASIGGTTGEISVEPLSALVSCAA